MATATDAITLPDESNAAFYGTTENLDVPFQRIMRKIGTGDMKDVILKDEGKELTLRFSLRTADAAAARIEEARRKIEELLS